MSTLNYAVVIEGLASLADFDKLPDQVIASARQAINRTLDTTRTRSARMIAMQVNFTAAYLSQGQGRLKVDRRATDSRLEGNIVGRHRPTSLARFVRGSTTPNKAGITVEVKPGSARFMKRAFLIRLRRGSAEIETQHNLGLAIRLRKGGVVHNKREMVRLSGNLYLLYGPSVDQVFNKVRDDAMPQAFDDLESEFLRLLALRHG